MIAKLHAAVFTGPLRVRVDMPRFSKLGQTFSAIDFESSDFNSGRSMYTGITYLM